jgi:hypothetical protein
MKASNSLVANRWFALFFVALASCGLRPPDAWAQAAPIVNWDNSFLLQGNAPGDPMVRVYLNPQPEPPMLPEVVMTDPVRPLVRVPEGQNPHFVMAFSISDDQPLIIDNPGTIDDQGHCQLAVRNATGGLEFQVYLNLGTSSGGVPVPGEGGWTWLNPQPEPPMSTAIGLDFQFNHMSEATLTMEVQNAGGQSLAFSAVPEPSGFALLLPAAVLALGWWRFRRRESKRGLS